MLKVDADTHVLENPHTWDFRDERIHAVAVGYAYQQRPPALKPAGVL